MNKYTAKFVRSADAQNFYDAKCVTEQARAGNYLTQCQLKGRTVTMWTETEPYGAGSYYESYFYSMLEQVGAWGSSSKGKATLSVNDGAPVKAPVSY